MRPLAPLRLLLPALLPVPLLAQEVAPCDLVPPATALIEPWEETAVALADGAVRLALLEGEEGTRRLLVLTLPPPAPTEGAAPDAAPEGGEAPESPPEGEPAAPPPERTCRIVSEGGLGFADLDLGGLSAEEDAEAGTLTLRLPALHFVPESTELAQQELVLVLGVADDSLAASLAE